MATDRSQEKPSLILMLAPVAVATLGYYYLFFSGLKSEVVERQRQASVLQEQTANFQLEKESLQIQLKDANKALSEAQDRTKLAKVVLAKSDAEKVELLALIRGNATSMTQNGVPQNLSSDSSSSLVGQLATMLTSTVSSSAEGGEATGPGLDTDGLDAGRCGHMSSLCEILDSHELRRLENSGPPRRSAESLIEAERTELGKLLGQRFEPSSRFEIRMEGRFNDLIAALHELDERLPAVSVFSVSLDAGDSQTRRRIWKLEVGIRG